MKIPSFEFEEAYWNQGISLVAGLDEVGMGAWAGPVVAGAVMFREETPPETQSKKRGFLIRDSKLLSPQQRDRAAVWIQENALSWAIGEASVEEIFELNILQAAKLAMQRAIDSLHTQPHVLLIDGNPPSHKASAGAVRRALSLPSEYIIKGDQKSFSIAAASILAKVHRDTFMIELGKQHPEYGFESHKGYGAKKHQEALKQFGITAHHRRAYAPIAAVLA